LVVGANDIYTQVLGGNQFFGALYAVATKNFTWFKNKFGVTMGYGFKPFRNDQYIGLFGGVSFSPFFSTK